MNNIRIREDELEFTFLGHALCLDFARTRKRRPTQHPQELLKSYADLVSWGQAAHAISPSQGQHLLHEAVQHPAESLFVLQQAIEVREAIYRIFEAIAEHEPLDDAAMSILNNALAQTMTHARIVRTSSGFSWEWEQDERAMERVLWPIVRSAADLLTSQEVGTVRLCAASDCSGLFIDTSKNHSRRWCDMTSCGNRAKARRHYERKRTTEVSST